MQASVSVSPRGLKLNALLGIGALILVFIEILGFSGINWTHVPDRTQWLLTNILFFNTVHIVLTMALLKHSEIYRQRWELVRLKMNWYLPLMVGVSAAIFFLFISRRFFQINETLILIFAASFPMFHVISQHSGLCLHLLPPGKERNITKFFWRLLIFVFVPLNVAVVLADTAPTVKIVLTLATVLPFIGLAVWSALVLRRHNPSWAAQFFHLKLLLYPLLLFNFTAGFLVSSLHGIEYLTMVDHDVKLSNLDLKDKSWIASAVLFIGALTWWAGDISSLWGLVCRSVLIGFVTLHYMLDGILFRSPAFYRR